MDINEDVTNSMENKFPKGLNKLLHWIMEGSTVQSWRYSGENSLILSIRFTSMQDITTSTHQTNLSSMASGGIIPSKAYRSKPPSSLTRDNMRHQVWRSGKQGGFDTDYIAPQDMQQGMFTNRTDMNFAGDAGEHLGHKHAELTNDSGLSIGDHSEMDKHSSTPSYVPHASDIPLFEKVNATSGETQFSVSMVHKMVQASEKHVTKENTSTQCAAKYEHKKSQTQPSIAFEKGSQTKCKMTTESCQTKFIHETKHTMTEQPGITCTSMMTESCEKRTRHVQTFIPFVKNKGTQYKRNYELHTLLDAQEETAMNNPQLDVNYKTTSTQTEGLQTTPMPQQHTRYSQFVEDYSVT